MMSYTISTRPTKKGLAFDLYFRWKGIRYRPLIGYDLTKEQAEQEAIKLIAKIHAGSQEQQVRHSQRTLRDLAPLFWDSFEVKKRVDRARPRGILENHLLPAFDDRPLTSLTAKDGLDYVLKRQKDQVSAGTIRREWQVLVRLLNLAVRYDWLDKNRFKAVELPDSDHRTRVATPPELESIRLLRDRVMPDVLRELWRVIVAELNTGLRESKLLAVQRSWIREEADGWWLILPPNQSRLKGTPDRLPLNASALWALRDPLPSITDGRVFRRWNDVRAFKKYWARACDLAKIQDLHFHDLRHTFATRLQGLGVDYEVRQALLGHRMPGLTASYSHGGPAWEQKLREAVTRLDQAFKLSYGLSYERKAIAAEEAQASDFCGEPPGTRTQGPRLKSVKERFLAAA
jgi:integrase